MKKADLTFGEFIMYKRQIQRITLRDMAKLLSFSAPFLSDVEKGRRYPPDIDKLYLISKILRLNDDETNYMFDLAGKKRNYIAPDIVEYIKKRDYVSGGLRVARDLDANEDDWLRFMNDLESGKLNADSLTTGH